MNCSVCREEFQDGERVVFNVRETFVFKPADVPDTVNPAKVSPEELLESRKDHVRTAIAVAFADFGKDALPENAFSVRHMTCDVQRTGAGASGLHPVTKHAIRYSRNMAKRTSK